MNAPGTWYTVVSVESKNKIIIESDITVPAGSPYVLRLCWSGDENDFHSATAIPIDEVHSLL